LKFIVAAALAYGLFLYASLPGFVTVLNDDFGYLRSVVATIQHGRPWTDDWLEPWAASFSSLTALLYLLTGNFHFATYGLLAALAGASFLGLALLLRKRGHPAPSAILGAGLVLTFPTLLWKQVEFTGVALHIPCLLWAIWTARQGRWHWFFLCWALALANRQSALAWGIFPAVEILAVLGQRNWPAKRMLHPIGVIGAGLGLFALLRIGLPQTHAQLLLTDHAFEHIDGMQAVRFVAIGIAVFLFSAGIGGAFFFLSRTARGFPARWSGLSFLSSAIVAVFFFVDPRTFFSFEHSGFFGPYGGRYTRLLVAVAALGWLRTGLALDRRLALCALGCLVLPALRAELWDYYLIDVGLLGLLAIRLPPLDGQPAGRPIPPLFFDFARAGLALLVAGTALLQFHFTYRLKLTVDAQTAYVRMTEQALRAGKLEVTEIGHTTIGFIGWYLYPYFVAHEGAEDRGITGFVRYLKADSVEKSTSEPTFSRTSLETTAGGEPRLIETIVHRCAWIFFRRYTLLRGAGANLPPATALDPRAYRRIPFPLDNGEWAKLIARPP
jgi:hypothetical protein